MDEQKQMAEARDRTRGAGITERPHDLSYLVALSDLRQIRLTSHRRIVGWLIVAMKRILRKFLAPVLDQQTEFNLAAAQVIDSFQQEIRQEIRREIGLLRARLDGSSSTESTPSASSSQPLPRIHEQDLDIVPALDKRADQPWVSDDRPTLSPQELHTLADSVPFWFHSIDFGYGVVTKGVKSSSVLAAEVERMRLPDLTGKTVLDIGAWDGFFSFEAERRGAAQVVSLDHFMWEEDPVVTRYYQDCRERGVPPDSGKIHAAPRLELPGKRGYDLAACVLGSKARCIVADFMALDIRELGQFDIVFYLGVLYHMEDPLRALRRLVSVTRELAIIESEAILLPGLEATALCQFYEGDELNQDASNWWAPNEKALEGMCRAAGFEHVETVARPPSVTRSTHLPPPTPRNYRIVLHAWKQYPA